LRYTVYWSQPAVDDLAGVFSKRPRDAQKVVLSVRTFGRDGRGDLKKLSGPTDEWRLRAGDWRVILTLRGDHAWISQVDNRRDAY
jgi:mRNA-degrading endonuclease RelE of RelBE toxin-antitoxin system